MDEIKYSGRRSIDFDAFERLESIDRNPYDDFIRQSAKKLEADINTGDADPVEAKERLAELNAMWPYVEQSLPVSGFAFLPQHDALSGEQAYTVEPVVNETLVSKGLSVIALSTSFEEEKWIRAEICQLFMRNDNVVCMPLNDTKYELPSRHPEMAEKNLLYYHNEQTLEVHRRIESWQGESDPIFSLADYSINISNSNIDRARYIEDMSSYLTGHFRFDTQLPYIVAVSEKGPLYISDEQGYAQADHNKLSGLCNPGAIVLFPEDASVVMEEATYIPHLEIMLHGRGIDSDPRVVYVPIKHIEKFVSVRREIYGGI